MAHAVQPVARPASVLGGNPRLGRALLYLHQQVRNVTERVVRAKLGQLMAAGEAMDYAVRLRGHRNELTPTLAAEFAVQAGFPQFRLHSEVLPKLKAADLIDYQLSVDGIGLSYIQEFVGLSGRVIEVPPVARTPAVWGQTVSSGWWCSRSNVTGLCIPVPEWRL